LDGAVHLKKLSLYPHDIMNYLPCTPALNNTQKEGLLWVISYIQSESIDNPLEMPIRAANNVSLFHEGLKCFEYFGQSRVYELVTELAKISIILMFMVS